MNFSGGKFIGGIMVAVITIFALYVFVRFLVPLMIIVGVGIFLYVKIKGYLNRSKTGSDTVYKSNTNSAKKPHLNDDLDGEVIDVDYKDV